MIDFVHLRASDRERIRECAEKGEVEEILAPFKEWLALWKDGSWIDYEKISLNVIDLRQTGVWERVPFGDFVESVRGGVCCGVLAHLEGMQP